LVVQAIKHSHDRMIVTHGTHGGFMQRLSDIMGSREVVDLEVELVCDIEHDLGEKPIIRLVKLGVGEVLADVGSDTQRQ
jgi:hypothetical protein